jgi:hypothetical protein
MEYKPRYRPGFDEPISPLPVNKKRPRKRDKNLEKMPKIIDDRNGYAFPQPMPYTPIKQTKSVNKVYKTY